MSPVIAVSCDLTMACAPASEQGAAEVQVVPEPAGEAK
jgi:hypothetical protein